MFSPISYVVLSICYLLGLLTLVNSAALPDGLAGQQFDVLDKPLLFEGDIAGVFPAGKKFRSGIEEDYYLTSLVRSGVLSAKRRWPAGRMPYEISDLFTAPERQLILTAIAEINDNAHNFQIVLRISEANHVYISRGEPGTGCYAAVGKQVLGGRQPVNLEAAISPDAPTCIHHGVIVHELMHAAGFYHEQARTDRDDHVDINFSNIAIEKQKNFKKYESLFVTDFNLPYDYDSIMHYGRFEFALDPTVYSIRPKSPHQDLPIGQRRGLNAKDIAKLNAMYPV